MRRANGKWKMENVEGIWRSVWHASAEFEPMEKSFLRSLNRGMLRRDGAALSRGFTSDRGHS